MSVPLQVEQLKRLGIVAANHIAYVEAVFNCMELGHVAVPLRSADDRDRIQAAQVDQVVIPEPGEGWMQRNFTASRTNTPALIAFTSGTEGAPKGVILTHNNLAEVITRLNSLMQVDDSIREYIGVPVYHSFGFGRCRAVSTAGGQFFLPSNGFNPSEIASMLKSGEINAISAVPSLWRVLLANQDLIGSYGRRIRWIEIGSQYMSQQEKEALKALFPEARIVQHYGLTEASRTTLLEVHEAEGTALESVGRAIGRVEVKLTEEGQIAIRGEHVAQGYLIDGEEVEIKDKEGWFLTNDLGSVEDGYLYYKGRADDVINCGGIKVHPEALESKIYTQIGFSSGIAVCRKKDSMRGEGFLVAVAKEVELDRQELREAVLAATQEMGVSAANAIAIVDVDHLPKTATGKIQRRQLAEWYEREFSALEPQADSSALRSENVAPIRSIFGRAFKVQSIKPQDTFISLGGDSLSYVQLSMDLERHLGYLPRNWEQISLSDLEQLTPQRRLSTLIEMNVLLRAIAIMGVIITQSGFPVVEGGAFLLLLIAGLNFSRFQGCALIQGRFQAIVPLLKHILVPYLLLAISYQMWKRNFDPLVLFLLGNFQLPEIQTSNSIFFVWFIANLVQSIILFSLPFAIPAVRTYAGASPWRYGLAALAVSIIARSLGPFLWDSSYLADQVPHMLMWLFTLGWCINFAKSKAEKITTTIAVFALTSAFIGFYGFYGVWVLIGGTLLLWLPYAPIPTVIKTPIQTVSAASYYIYLTILIFKHLVTRVAGIESPLVLIPAILLGGVMTWAAVQTVQQRLLNRRSQKAGYIDSPQY